MNNDLDTRYSELEEAISTLNIAINEVENLIKEEQKKPIYNRNNFTLVSKIKEVITSDQTR